MCQAICREYQTDFFRTYVGGCVQPKRPMLGAPLHCIAKNTEKTHQQLLLGSICYPNLSHASNNVLSSTPSLLDNLLFKKKTELTIVTKQLSH